MRGERRKSVSRRRALKNERECVHEKWFIKMNNTLSGSVLLFISKISILAFSRFEVFFLKEKEEEKSTDSFISNTHKERMRISA